MKVEILSLGSSGDGWFARYSQDGEEYREPVMCWALSWVYYGKPPYTDEPFKVVVGIIEGPAETGHTIAAIEDGNFEGYDRG